MKTSFINIDQNTDTPKYLQLANAIREAIDNGNLTKGDILPSLNTLKKEFALSQDTSLAAYRFLMQQGIVRSSFGRGYFVNVSRTGAQHKVFLLFDKLSLFKETLYNAICEEFGSNGSVELFVHNNNIKVFGQLITDAIGNYTDFIIIPPQHKQSETILEALPRKRTFLLDMVPQELRKTYSCVFQDFNMDVFKSLQEAKEHIRKYNTIKLIVPQRTGHFLSIEEGIQKYCLMENIEFEVAITGHQCEVNRHDLFIIIHDGDLASIIKECKAKKLAIGSDVGLISYNDSPLKELIADGITTISTDFRAMGQKIATMVIQQSNEKIKNQVRFTLRNSL
jgi:DNA-binding transcriptional regulator YhcF (GntR family)